VLEAGEEYSLVCAVPAHAAAGTSTANTAAAATANINTTVGTGTAGTAVVPPPAGRLYLRWDAEPALPEAATFTAAAAAAAAWEEGGGGEQTGWLKVQHNWGWGGQLASNPEPVSVGSRAALLHTSTLIVAMHLVLGEGIRGTGLSGPPCWSWSVAAAACGCQTGMVAEHGGVHVCVLACECGSRWWRVLNIGGIFRTCA
jgi:hypothetical protein